MTDFIVQTKTEILTCSNVRGGVVFSRLGLDLDWPDSGTLQ